VSKITKKTIPAACIDRMVKRIVKRFHSETIILFGSHARGQAGPDSDIDLLVVMEADGPVRDIRLEIMGVLHDIPIPTDVIVTTPEDFGWRKGIVGTIDWPATREGKALYARAQSGDRGGPRLDRQSRK
jgi:predicted nucleotidyltransferase